MPLVSYAVARRAGAVCTSHRTPQVTVPLPKHKGKTTRSAHDTVFPARYRLGIAVALFALVPNTLEAQRVTGPWEDGTIAPPGILRIGISPRFEQWKERHSRLNGTRESLGGDFTLDSLGPSIFPFVSGLAPLLSTLTGLSVPPLTLGSLQTHLDVTQTTTSISLEYGLTRRLGLQAVVPYVKNRVHVIASANSGGVGATLGFNPAQSIEAARQQNGQVVTTLGAAASTLSSELTRCLGISDPTCAAINSNRAGATALVQTTTQVSDALAAVFGTPAIAGGLYAPVAGSVLHSAVDARLADLNTQYRTFLGAPTSGEWIGARPVAAVPLAAAGLDVLLGDPALGIAARPLGDYEHSHVGDIEIGAKVLLVDTFGPNATAPLPRAGALRLAAAGIYRLGTAQLDLPRDFTDVGTGDRQPDLEVRGHADVAFGPRFWTSVIARFGLQRPDRLVRRITDQPGDPFPELAREQDVGRDLGDVLEFEVSPRYVPNDEFAVSALYRFRGKGTDSYSGTFQLNGADGTPLSFDAATLGIDSEQKEHLLGFAVTYSTVQGYTRRRAKWPLEISYVHTQVMSGRGIPRVQTNAIAFRFYRPTRGNSLRP